MAKFFHWAPNRTMVIANPHGDYGFVSMAGLPTARSLPNIAPPEISSESDLSRSRCSDC